MSVLRIYLRKPVPQLLTIPRYCASGSLTLLETCEWVFVKSAMVFTLFAVLFRLFLSKAICGSPECLGQSNLKCHKHQSWLLQSPPVTEEEPQPQRHPPRSRPVWSPSETPQSPP